MNKRILLSAVLLTLLAGCGEATTSAGSAKPADDTSSLCTAVENMGLSNQCKVDTHYGSLDVMIDSFDDEVARRACANIAQKLAPLVASYTGTWKLQVFSPYRSDKATATCPLH